MILFLDLPMKEAQVWYLKLKYYIVCITQQDSKQIKIGLSHQYSKRYIKMTKNTY